MSFLWINNVAEVVQELKNPRWESSTWRDEFGVPD
jgi:hypothetical protein